MPSARLVVGAGQPEVDEEHDVVAEGQEEDPHHQADEAGEERHAEDLGDARGGVAVVAGHAQVEGF